MRDVPSQPLFYLQDSTQIEKSPDETAVSARCLISQSVAGGWRRPLPLTQHLSPLRSERLSFLFVLSYYYYQGNFQLSTSTRQQPVGVSRHFSDWGRSGRGRGRGRGEPTSDFIYQLSHFSQSATLRGLFLSRSAPFSFLLFSIHSKWLRRNSSHSREAPKGTPTTQGETRPSTCQRVTTLIHKSVHQISLFISVCVTQISSCCRSENRKLSPMSHW